MSDVTTARQLLRQRLTREQARATGPGLSRRAAAPGSAGPSGGGPAVSLFFFSADLDDRAEEKYELVLECAELADRLGLHAVWVPERHFDPFGAPYPSPGLLLAAIATRTRRIGLRAGSVVLPLRDPLLVAEEWGVLDALARGRTGLSLASGWHADDFVLNPEGFERRKEVLTERLEVLRRLWQGEAVSRPGPGGRSVEVRTHPRPSTPPDVWLTSSVNPATWQAAGSLGLNVLTALLEQSVQDVATKVALYRQSLADAGHAADGGQVTCMLHTHLAADADVVESRVREPLLRYLSAHLDLFTKFAGTTDVGVRPDQVTDADRQALLEHGLRRYLDGSGLFGTAVTCRPMVDRLRAAGVTELGCLVDFGLPPDQVLDSVRELGVLQRSMAVA